MKLWLTTGYGDDSVAAAMLRRNLLIGGLPLALAGAPKFTKGVCWAAWPAGTPYSHCIAEAAAAGFQAIEIRVDPKGELSLSSTVADADRVAKIAKAKGVAISSLWALTPSSPSLVSASLEVRQQALALARKAIELAPALGCDAILAVPGVLGRAATFEVTHDEAWKRATEGFRELLPLAAAARVTLTPENVWSKFLVSPLDMRAFVDQFKSPFVKVHFDTGNIMQYGYPEDWILTLGHRIHRIHFKDFKLGARGVQGQFTPLLEGDVNWKSVINCLVKIGYSGPLTVEAGPAIEHSGYLLRLSQAMDRILSLA
jgi:L-ribulose-5-phosphate 3-epimerase